MSHETTVNTAFSTWDTIFASNVGGKT